MVWKAVPDSFGYSQGLQELSIFVSVEGGHTSSGPVQGKPHCAAALGTSKAFHGTMLQLYARKQGRYIDGFHCEVPALETTGDVLCTLVLLWPFCQATCPFYKTTEADVRFTGIHKYPFPQKKEEEKAWC